MILLATTWLLAHSWYPHECCSDKDCFPVPCEKIKSVGDAYFYLNNSILKSRAQPSQDSQCHVCADFSHLYCIFIGGVS